MNKSKALCGGLILLSAISLAAASAPAVDFSGTWVGKVETGMGVDELTLTLKKGETGFAGIISDSLGLIEKDSPVADVVVDSAAISFSFKAMGGSMEFTMTLTLAGDKLSGELQNKAENGRVPFEFVRKK